MKKAPFFFLLTVLCALTIAAFPTGAFADDESAAYEGLLVTYRDTGVSLQSKDAESSVEAALTDAGVAVGERVASMDGSTVVMAQPSAGQSVDEAINRVLDIDGVVAAQPNYAYELVSDGGEKPSAGVARDGNALKGNYGMGDVNADITLLSTLYANDPFAQYSSSKHIPNQYWLYSTGLVDAWSTKRANGAVTVAVLDSAVDVTHEDLAANMLTDYAYDAVDDAPLNATEADLSYSDGHGTNVAGIISGVANNGRGIAGGSFNANILPIMVIRDRNTYTSNIIRGLNYILNLVQQGNVPTIRVVNMSLRMGRGQSWSDANTTDHLVEKTIEKLRTYGVVTVCAGGNGDHGVAGTSFTFPADDDACVSVTALLDDGSNWSGSDYNQYKDISAPGVGVWSTSIASGPYGRYSSSLYGTSQAAPMVSAAFALLFAEDPSATVSEACNALYNTAGTISYREDDAVDQARKEQSGTHGSLRADAALVYLQRHNLADVSLDDWFYGAVDYVSERGIMTGYTDSSGYVYAFGPNDTLTRGQAATLLWRYEGQPAAARANKDDVDQNAYYAQGVNWAIASGVMSGYDGTNSFGPNNALTREQAAKIVAKVAGASVSTADSTAFDSLWDSGSTSATLRAYMVWAVDKGVINGVDYGTYKSLEPRGTITRAQMARIMQNSITNGVL